MTRSHGRAVPRPGRRVIPAPSARQTERAAVWAYLRHRLPAGSVLASTFAADFVGLVTLIPGGFTTFNLLLYRHRGPESSTLLYDLTFGLLAMSGLPTAVALGSFTVASTATGYCRCQPLTLESSPPPHTCFSWPHSS